MKPVCLVFGAGAGIGGTVAAKFAQESPEPPVSELFSDVTIN